MANVPGLSSTWAQAQVSAVGRSTQLDLVLWRGLFPNPQLVAI
jgi:hypothetical protein